MDCRVALILVVLLSGCESRQEPVSSPTPSEPVPQSGIPPQLAWAVRDAFLRYTEATLGREYISLMGGQVQQESWWDCEAESRFAVGCSQFTPDTAKWAGDSICRGLGRPAPKDWRWALPCQTRYMAFILRQLECTNQCECAAFALSGYNGGAGWAKRDQRICAEKAGCDPGRWFNNVEHYSNRADWAFKENRDYPEKIVHKWQPQYVEAGYGGRYICGS